MSFKFVRPSIKALNLGICNCFLLKGSSGYAIVDTGLEKHGDTILKGLSEEGILPTEIKYILLTHAHPDHAGSAAQLKNRPGPRWCRMHLMRRSSRAAFISGR